MLEMEEGARRILGICLGNFMTSRPKLQSLVGICLHRMLPGCHFRFTCQLLRMFNHAASFYYYYVLVALTI